MYTPQKAYLNDIYKHTSFRANWLPDKPIRIGDVGKLENGIFTLYTTLEQQGLHFSSRESTALSSLDYVSNNTAFSSSDISVDGRQVTADIKALISIEFSSGSGIIFQMDKAKKVIIEDLNKIESQVLSKYKDDDWPKEWVVITEIIVAETATIIISTSSSNKLEFQCEAPLANGFKLANPSLNLKLRRETGSSTKILGANDLSPLFQVHGIVEPFFSNPKFRHRFDPTESVSNAKLKSLAFDFKEI